MKQYYKISNIILLIILITSILVTTAYANSAEPPCLTVIVSFPIEDLTLSIRFANGDESDAILLKKEQKAWETYYRFYYGMTIPSRSSLYDATIIVASSESSFECPLPASTFKQYNNVLSLDLKNERIIVGQKPFREPLLIGMRVALTLIIEGLIFFAFGYRNKKSWITFLFINLLTQGALNILLSGPVLNAYWIFGYVFYEIIIFFVEAFAFDLILQEQNKDRVFTYAFIANFLSLILGGALIGYLPV